MLTKYLVAIVMSLVTVSAVMAAGSSSSSTQPSNSNYENGVKAVENSDFKLAVKLLTRAVADKPKDADAWNYLGFSNRKLKNYNSALTAYQQALSIDPKHRGANEYLGELYLQTDELAKARERLKKLDEICYFGCDEYNDLKAAIAAYENN
jgi:Flp pilus assembly protein TadD